MNGQLGMIEQLYEEAAERAKLAGAAFEAIRQALADHEVGELTSADTVAAVREAMQQRDDGLEAFRRGVATARQAAVNGGAPDA